MALPIQKLREVFPDQIQPDFTLGSRTTLRSGGTATFLSIDSPEKGQKLLALRNDLFFPMLILGRGSNLLVADGPLDLLVAVVKNQTPASALGDGTVTFSSGTLMPAAMHFAHSNNLEGMEWATGIPGTMGGAVRMNAGTKQGELKDHFLKARILASDGERTFSANDLNFSYRHSSLAEDDIIWDVTMGLRPVDKNRLLEIKESVRTYLAFRNATQPLKEANFGSTFVNPPGHHAAKLIEEAGLKGRRRGNMMVSMLHANFLVNAGGGLSRDARDLIHEIQDTVEKKTGIRLKTEVCLVGF